MKIRDIKWDLSDLSKEERESINLPTEVDVEKDLGIDISTYNDLSELEEEISDKLSAGYGYCHCGFRYDPTKTFRITVVDKATYDRLVGATQISDSIVGSEESKSQEDGEKMLAGNFFTDLYVKDKLSGEVHRVGDDVHDSLTVDDFGTVHYYNMQNGDGCGANSKKNITLKEKYPETDWGNRADELVYGYEFVPCPKECYLCEYEDNCRSVRK